MNLSSVSKTLVVSAKVAEVPVRCHKDVFGRFCFDRGPSSWQRPSRGQLPIKPMMCDSRTSRRDSEQASQRGTSSC